MSEKWEKITLGPYFGLSTNFWMTNITLIVDSFKLPFETKINGIP